MIKGIGIDTVEISRMAKNLDNAHFMQRVFSAAERDYIGCGNLAAERAAGNFAAKEALAKALGCGLAGCPPDRVEVLRDENGAPFIRVYGVVLRRFEELGASKEWVSITHTGRRSAAGQPDAGGLASAVVVLEGD